MILSIEYPPISAGIPVFGIAQPSWITLPRLCPLIVSTTTWQSFFAYHGLGRYFKDTECYGNNELEKSENIKLIVERNNIDEAVYVGDIQGDYDSSKKAGVKFIHAAYGFGTIDDDVPAIRKFSELPQVADRVFDEIEKH